VVAGAGTTVLLPAMGLAETTNANRLAEVDVTGDGSGANVKPVHALGRELLEVAGLDGVNPSGNRELSLTLQESGIGIDELLSIDIANRDSRHFGGCRGCERVGRGLSLPEPLWLELKTFDSALEWNLFVKWVEP